MSPVNVLHTNVKMMGIQLLQSLILEYNENHYKKGTMCFQNKQ